MAKSFNIEKNHKEYLSIRPLLIRLFLSLLIFSVAFGVVVWRIDQAPDIFTDEILYSRLGLRVLEEGAIVWDHGSMSVIHPPYYYLLDAVFMAATGSPGGELYTPGDIFGLVYHDRILNAILAGLTAVILFLIGLRLRGFWLGIFFTLLFFIDPFGVRINRRAMLETSAALLTLIGLLIFIWGSKDRNGSSFGILSGIFFGAGILTKELAFIVPLAVLIYGIWEIIRKSTGWRNALITSGIAFGSYLIFPIWVIYTGNWSRFVVVKTLAMERLVGLVHTSGWNRPGVSLLDFISNRLLEYGSSYLILLLGGVATLLILFRHRNEATGRLLGIWGLLVYPFYIFLTFFGSGNDQFFYFLLLPSIIFLGYALIEKGDYGMRRLLVRSWNMLRSQPLALYRMRDITSWLLFVAGSVILIIILPFNVFSWMSNFGLGVDNGYFQLTRFIQSNIPVGTPINASGDPLKFSYFLAQYPIGEVATPQEAVDIGLQYFVIAPKDIQAKFGNISEEFATWIISNGQLIFSTSGETYGDIFLYNVPIIREPEGEPLPGSWDTMYQRTFPMAETGFVGALILLMAIWYLLCIWMLIGAVRRKLRQSDKIVQATSIYNTSNEREFQDVS